MYFCKEGKLLGTCGPGGGGGGSSATVAAAAAAGTLVEEGRERRLFLPILDATLEMGAGVGLLAWMRSKGFVRVREAVSTCIGGGGGRAFGVVWRCASISESESPLSPHDACGTFESAAHCPIWAGRTGVCDHVSGFELSRSEGPHEVGVLADIFWQETWAFWCYHQVLLAWGYRYLDVEVN